MSIDNIYNAQKDNFNDSFVESIDVFLDELSQLANTEETSARFYHHATSRLRDITGSDAALVWALLPSRNCIAISGMDGHVDSSKISLSADTYESAVSNDKAIVESNRQFGSTIAAAIGAGNQTPKVLALHFQDNRFANPSDLKTAPHVRFLCDLLAAISDIADKLENRLTVQSQQQRYSQIESFLRLVQNVSSSLDANQVAFHVVNDSRTFLQAERVWLFSNDGRANLLACSSVDSVNKRSKDYLTTKRLADRAVKGQIASQSGCIITPLKQQNSDRTIGVLIAEFDADTESAAVVAMLNQIVPPIQLGLGNAITHSRIPFRRSLQRLNWIGNRFRLRALPRTGFILAVVAAAIAALFLIKTEHLVDIEGKLRPLHERHVFAPTDAYVDSVLVAYGDMVTESQPVIQLRSNEYELKLTELQNELSAVKTRIESNRLMRSQARNQSGDESQQALYVGQLTAEIEKNLQEVSHLNTQIEWFIEKQTQLCLKAPIDGQVITPDLHTNLISRPVQQGNHLLSIADTHGTDEADAEWQIVFEVEDRNFGYMLDAIENGSIEEWSVQYRLESRMDSVFDAKINSTDQNNSIREDFSFIKAFVPVDAAEFDELRVGQSVLGKVNCGRKSLFEIWTRDVRDFIRTRYMWF